MVLLGGAGAMASTGVVAVHLTLILLSMPRGARAGVVADFNHAQHCNAFLYMGTPPRGYLRQASYRKICQQYEDRPRYVTLYDPRKRIPVYSAYTFQKSDDEKTVDFPWMFEPQLASDKGSSNMEPFHQSSSSSSSSSSSNFPVDVEDSQAMLEDYAEAVRYKRGQLNPDSHQADPLDKAATYTLTNVVPQSRVFAKPWAENRRLVRNRLNNFCSGRVFVVTGVTTAGATLRRGNVDRVGVPDYVWSAYCCAEFDRNAPYFERYKFPAFAAYGLNDGTAGGQVVEVPLKNLEKFLRDRMEVDHNFQIFFNNCVPD